MSVMPRPMVRFALQTTFRRWASQKASQNLPKSSNSALKRKFVAPVSESLEMSDIIAEKIVPPVQTVQGHRICFIVDDRIIFEQPPIADVINEVVRALLASRNSQLALPLDLVRSRWTTETGTPNKRSLHDRMCATYYPFFQSEPGLFKTIFKNPDLNLNLILQRYYEDNCHVTRARGVLRDLDRLGQQNRNSALFVAKASMWNEFKFDYEGFLRRKLSGVIANGPKILDSNSQLANFDKFFIVTNDSDTMLQKFKTYHPSTSTFPVSVINVFGPAPKSNAFVKSVESFRFFERLSNFKQMKFLYSKLLQGHQLLHLNDSQFKDLLYVLERGNTIH